jgi:lauroyl/myristoyl acyltransferase
VCPNSAATVTNAFGLAHCVPALHAILAQRTRSLIVPVTAEPLEDGRLRITVHPPVPDPVEGEPHSVTASRVWAVFEAIIRARPEYWLWAYKHFRYKPRGAAENEYPFYANESGAFEKVLRKVREEEALFAAQGVHTKMQ